MRRSCWRRSSSSLGHGTSTSSCVPASSPSCSLRRCRWFRWEASSTPAGSACRGSSPRSGARSRRRAAARWYVAYLVVFLGSGIAGAAGWRVAGCPRVVHEHDARPQRHGGRHDRVHAAGRVRRPAPKGARGAARGAGAVEGLLLNILPRSIADKLEAETQTIADQFSRHRSCSPTSSMVHRHGAPAAGRGRQHARPPVQPLRCARRAPRGREDQDDRRLLHGRRRRPHLGPTMPVRSP